MADLEDVMNAVYNQVIQAVYPNGTSNPSVAGVDVTIIKGWPIKEYLMDAMKAGQAIVSIYPTNKLKDITKFERIDKTVSIAPATITVTIIGLLIVFGGVISVPQSIIVTIDGINYQYTVLITDTLSTIAAAFAGMIPSAVAVLDTVILSDGFSIVVNIATESIAALDLGRQEQEFLIACWCPSNAIRVLLAPPIDNYMRINYQFPIPPDNFYIFINYDRTELIDKLQIPLILRRDLYYKIQYSTTQSAGYTTVAKTVTNTQLIQGGLIQ